MIARLFTVAAFGAFGWAAVSSGPLGATPTPADCVLTFEPAAVELGSSAEVHSTASEDVGMVDAVSADPESGLFVSLGEADEGAFHLNVDASEANPGEWDISLVSEGEPVCTGALAVN